MYPKDIEYTKFKSVELNKIKNKIKGNKPIKSIKKIQYSKLIEKKN